MSDEKCYLLLPHYRLPRTLALLLLVGLLCSASAALSGQAEDILFEEANLAYSQGDYGQAIVKYQQINQTAGYSSSVLFNLANSYAQSGQPGKAILNYERALRLAPSDIDISGNLQLVKKENGLFPHEPSRTERFFQLLNLNQWTTLALLALVIASCFLAASLKHHFSRQWKISVAAGSLLLFSLAISGSLHNYQFFNPAVVISPDVKLFVSPFEGSASTGSLQEGRLVYPKKNHGDFSYVTDEIGRKGWIHISNLETVCRQ